MISLLSTARTRGQLGLEELVATCGLLLIAGFETTVNLLGNAIRGFATAPLRALTSGTTPTGPTGAGSAVRSRPAQDWPGVAGTDPAE